MSLLARHQIEISSESQAFEALSTKEKSLGRGGSCFAELESNLNIQNF